MRHPILHLSQFQLVAINRMSIQSLTLLCLIPLIITGQSPIPEDSQLEPVSYENFTLFRVSSQDSPFLIEDGFHDGLIIAQPDLRTSSYDILVPPRSKADFLLDLKARHWSYSTINSNVQELIDEERQQVSRAGSTYGWDQYHSYEETTAWMKQLSQEYPDQVTLINLGKSHQNRNTYGLKLSRRGNNPAVFIEAGVHSREWIGPATSTFIFHQLLTSEDPEIRRLSQDYDWYVVPMVNPDGYVFTRANRMWRKNLRRNLLCVGVDVNRNWGYHWREAGSSSFACSDQYAGPGPMSEAETRNLDKFMGTISDRVKLYLSFHSFSQLLLWPEGHTRERIPEYDDYERIGKATVEAIAVRYGTEYERGSIIEAIYPASGSTIDYMRSTYKIPLAFCFELRPKRDDPGVGFILSPDQIRPTGEETLDGVGAMVREGQALGYFKL